MKNNVSKELMKTNKKAPEKVMEYKDKTYAKKKNDTIAKERAERGVKRQKKKKKKWKQMIRQKTEKLWDVHQKRQKGWRRMTQIVENPKRLKNCQKRNNNTCIKEHEEEKAEETRK